MAQDDSTEKCAIVVLFCSCCAMEKAGEVAVDPVEVKAGSGSDVEGEADVRLNDSGIGAPQGYQQFFHQLGSA